MDSGPQAYGLGRSTGHVDIHQFLKTTPVLIRLLCLVCKIHFSILSVFEPYLVQFFFLYSILVYFLCLVSYIITT